MPSLACCNGRHVREADSMKEQNDWIFKRIAFAVVPLPAFEYELFSIEIKINRAYLCNTKIPRIAMWKNVEQQVVNLSPGIFLRPF